MHIIIEIIEICSLEGHDLVSKRQTRYSLTRAIKHVSELGQEMKYILVIDGVLSQYFISILDTPTVF